jgi:pimeloyl-ACP methyl ester carboxylesterase
MMSVATQTLSPPSRTLMFLEGRAISELGAFLGALPLLSLAPRGDGHPVLVLPGLVASDTSTRPLRSFLKSRGYAVSGWRQGRNLGLRHGVQNAMVDLVQELNDTHGRKVSLVGWSLGGLYARQLAKMMPERVRSVITLGSPFATGPKATNAWRVYEMASGRRADEEDSRFGGALSATPPVPTTATTVSAPGRAAWKRPRRHRRASRSKAAIAAWAITPPRSTPSPIAWRRRKANGRRSIEAVGAVWCIRIRIGRAAGSCLPRPALAGRGRIALATRVRGGSAY